MQESILNDVFMTVYEKAGQLLDFKNGCPEEEKDKMFRAWMGTTARNFFLKIADEYERQFIDVEEREADSLYELGGSHSSRIPRMESLSEIENFGKTDEPETVIDSKKLAELKMALNQMDEGDRDIILLYANFEDENGHSNLPNYLRNSYAEKHQILPDSVRRKRQRALIKLKSKLNL
jgi:DNA-directed RNA polymerase specialized sigma24 family protein